MRLIAHCRTWRSMVASGVALVAVAVVGTVTWSAHARPCATDTRAVVDTVSAALVAEQQIGALYPGRDAAPRESRDTRSTRHERAQRARHWLAHPEDVRRASAHSVERLDRVFAGPLLDRELAVQRRADTTYERFAARFGRTGALPTGGTSFTVDGGATGLDVDAIDVSGDTAHVTGSATLWLETDAFEPSGVVAYSPSRPKAIDAHLERTAAGDWRVVSMTMQPSGL